MNISEVSMSRNKAMERDIGKTDIAAAEGILAVGDMDFEAAEEGQCGSSEPAICATLFCS
jgi:hypothetical protein